jgi:hypothetical protein
VKGDRIVVPEGIKTVKAVVPAARLDDHSAILFEDGTMSEQENEALVQITPRKVSPY